MINPLALGAVIKNLRLARRITQEELATSLGLSVNYLSQVENGRRGITIPTLNELAIALDVPASFITSLAETETGNDLRDRLLKQIRQLIAVAVKIDVAQDKSRRKRMARTG